MPVITLGECLSPHHPSAQTTPPPSGPASLCFLFLFWNSLLYPVHKHCLGECEKLLSPSVESPIRTHGCQVSLYLTVPFLASPATGSQTSRFCSSCVGQFCMSVPLPFLPMNSNPSFKIQPCAPSRPL